VAAQRAQQLPAPASHNFTVLSELPLASVLPSGLHATESTKPAWPLSVRSSCPLPLSHNFTVLSSHCRWPASCRPDSMPPTLTGAGVAAQRAQQLPAPAIPQLHRIRPRLPLASVLPSGLHATEVNSSWWRGRSACAAVAHFPLSHSFTVLSHCRWPASCRPDSRPPR
jgi:hypothetical protein